MREPSMSQEFQVLFIKNVQPHEAGITPKFDMRRHRHEETETEIDAICPRSQSLVELRCDASHGLHTKR